MTDQTVVLIGNGSSGIQILPAILDQVKKIFVLNRSRTWITPALANRFAGENGANKIFSEEEQKSWSQVGTPVGRRVTFDLRLRMDALQ